MEKENQYIYYEDRLNSLMNKWPHSKNYLADPKKLAKAGFYIHENDDLNDVVTCFMCKKSLDGWEADDDPWTEHVKHSSTCPLVNLNLKENRILLFRKCKWPHMEPNIEKMAEAGFFFFPRNENDDTAFCIKCGIALEFWEPNDSPKAEHEKRNPNCNIMNVSLKPQENFFYSEYLSSFNREDHHYQQRQQSQTTNKHSENEFNDNMTIRHLLHHLVRRSVKYVDSRIE